MQKMFSLLLAVLFLLIYGCAPNKSKYKATYLKQDIVLTLTTPLFLYFTA